ncbi:LysR family transcriptional regulator [Streptomyces sp. SDT5-1]|uniref:LysR family transcriptional regulator n=1 Tax=Streptomyces sp. SDT5-1 TaxID=3406418 RepID=UPI003FD096C9
MPIPNASSALTASRDLNMLFGLRALLEESNVTHAAARMGMGQPAMSGVLARLRTHYGDELLVRFGRDYELTPLARALLPHVQEATAAIEGLLGAKPRVFDPRQSTRSFTILSVGYGSFLLHARLLQLVQQAQGIRIDVVNGQGRPSPPVRDWLTHDLVLSPTVGPDEYRSIVLSEDRFVCVLGVDSPLAASGHIEWADFAGGDIAVGTCGEDTDARLRQVLMSQGVELSPVVAVEDPATAVSIVAETELIAVVPEKLALVSARTGELRVVEPPFGDVPIPQYLSWHAARDADPGLQWLVTALLDGAGSAARAT